jgi:hypothetical protein
MKKDRVDDLEREIRTHLDLEAEERVADGMSEMEARYAARRAFGNVTRTQEDVRACGRDGGSTRLSRTSATRFARCARVRHLRPSPC